MKEDEPAVPNAAHDEPELNNLPEADDWSDTPLSALKETSSNEDPISNIDATIQAVSEIDLKPELPPTSTVSDDNDLTDIPESEELKSTITEICNDIADDEGSPAVKSTSTTPQSTKTKRRSKSSRSKSSK